MKIKNEQDKTIQELQSMVDLDQSARSENPIDWNKTNKIDAVNTKKLKEIIAEHGWITISKFGERASQNCWLLAQHADLDPTFQRECLNLILKLNRREVSLSNIAFLTDRVLLKETGLQSYGTQMHGRGDKYMVMAPVEDIKNLDKRRSAMGLTPIKEHIKKFSRKTFLSEQEYKEHERDIRENN
jgi:hypothetical protein